MRCKLTRCQSRATLEFEYDNHREFIYKNNWLMYQNEVYIRSIYRMFHHLTLYGHRFKVFLHLSLVFSSLIRHLLLLLFVLNGCSQETRDQKEMKKKEENGKTYTTTRDKEKEIFLWFILFSFWMESLFIFFLSFTCVCIPCVLSIFVSCFE